MELVIKYRFTPEQLLKIKWWFWDDEKIKKLYLYYKFSSIDTKCVYILKKIIINIIK